MGRRGGGATDDHDPAAPPPPEDPDGGRTRASEESSGEGVPASAVTVIDIRRTDVEDAAPTVSPRATPSEPAPAPAPREDDDTGAWWATSPPPAGDAPPQLDAPATAPVLAAPAATREPDVVPPPLYEQGDGITRALCGHVHLYQPLAKQICDGLLGGNYNAAAPVWGVDLVALLRHAREAMQRWDARDQQLRWVTLGGLGIALFAVAIVDLGAIPWRVGLLLVFAAPLFVLLASFGVVFGHYAGARARAVAALKDPTPIRDQAGAGMSPDDVRAAEELATANVVCFDKSVPFVGDGRMLENWTLSLDLARAGRTDATAGTDVTASGLHQHLLRRLGDGPLTGVRVEQRLYVKGGNARKIEGLCDGWTHARVHPRSRIDPAVVESFADAPAAHARAYVAAQRISWGGQLVVTLLVHARLSGTVLHVEGSEHVLPPLKARFAKVGDFPDGRWRVLRGTLLASWRSTGRLVAACWPRLFAARRNARNWGRICRRNERAHRDGVPFNYGAGSSMRDDMSDPGRLLYYAQGDEVMSAVPMRRAALRAIAEYVQSFGYDVTDLREQEKQIDMVGVIRITDAATRLMALGAKS